MARSLSFGDLARSQGAQPDPIHVETQEKVAGAMETGHFGEARELIQEYALTYPDRAEALRLSLVRKYGTGL